MKALSSYMKLGEGKEVVRCPITVNTAFINEDLSSPRHSFQAVGRLLSQS